MKKIMIFISLLIILFIKEKNVYAQTLILDRQEGIYYARLGGDLPYYSSQFIIYRLGDEIAYCIEPSKNITTYNYVDTDGNINLPYSDEVKRKIQLIGYFGREYPGHDNVRYSMAAQALIWNLTSNQEITFYTKSNEQEDIIDVTNEKNVIMNLVNNYQELSIPHNLDGNYSTTMTFKDDNLVNYEISDYGGNDEYGNVTLEGNTLKISSKIIGNSYIELKRITYDDKGTLIYVGSSDNSQTLGRLRLPNNPYRINLNISGIKIRIDKRDEEGNSLQIPGIKFKVKNKETGEYICENGNCVYETNEKGYVFTKCLNFGTYEIEEVEDFIPGYTVNKEKKTVIIKREGMIFYTHKDGHFLMVDFINKKITGKLELQKKQENYVIIDDEFIYKMEDGANITFKLYKDSGEYLGELITNSNGYAEYPNLEIGNYYIEEIIPDKYTSNQRYTFSITQENSQNEVIIQNLEINNYLQKGDLEIKKIDANTLEGIPETTFDIYYEDKLLFSKETDENGLINLSNLPIGNYYLQETSANPKYQLVNDKKYFEIVNQDLTKLVIENEEIVVEVPETLDNTNYYLQLSSIFLIIGLMIYEKTH